MADDNVKKNKELLETKQKIRATDQDIADVNKVTSAEKDKQLKTSKSQTEELKKQTQQAKKQKDLSVAQLTNEEKLKEFSALRNREFSSMAADYRKLSVAVKQQLSDTSEYSGAVIRINKEIARQTAIQESNTGIVEQQAEAKKDFLSAIRSDVFAQAEATAKAKDAARGLTEFDIKRREIKEGSLNLSKEAKEIAIDMIDKQETLFKKEKEIEAIKESQQSLYEAMPESIKSAVDFGGELIKRIRTAGLAAGIFAVLAGILVSAVSLFQDLDQSAADFRRETGMTRSQMEGMNETVNNIVGNYAQLGISVGDVFNTVSALRSEFADMVDFSENVVASMTVLNKNFGVSVENAAKVQSIFEGIGGLSAETAASVQMQVVEMANLAGVAPARVIADIAESAEAASVFFGGNVEQLARAAVEARRLGSNLQTTVAVAEKLLDFQSSIESELEAAAFVGGQFNLTQARTLAATGETAKAQEEVLRQIQRTGDFREQDLWTQRALAEAAGMSVEEINRQLVVQDRLSKLRGDELRMAQEAIDAGIDITKINEEELGQQVRQIALQQEQQATMEQIKNEIMGIVTVIGASLVPLLETVSPIITGIASVVGTIFSGVSGIVNIFKIGSEELSVWEGILGSLAIIMTGLYALNKGMVLFKKAQNMWDQRQRALMLLRLKKEGALTAMWAMRNPIMAVAGISIAAVVGGLVASYISKVGDMVVPATGRTMVSTREGGLFELSPNDDLIAAPNLLDTPTAPPVQTEVRTDITTPKEMKELLNELRGLRADLREGKVGVYMDGKKVTSSIARVVDNMGVNNYGIA